ncbi:ABC transporter substrate-binding protein [Paenibacillus agricola]|uniref:ABC transporter substrate-binding protein n=1 Tax=Paenibacillus agricola TaxID=2716264 RepID=A0ABX0IY63_9BACL|nr:ABC transporter substrate-binding protein [Paenibacillus agricola]NHN28889.1 ABC transporter substrate-binding protein [Paenibacillus agricola]
MKNNKRFWGAMALSVMMVVLAACGGNGSAKPAETTGPANAASTPVTTSGINWGERIAANKAAGEITTMTSFNYSANIANTNAWIADELGFFKELGLNVSVMPGLSADAMKLLAVGKLQVAHAGSASEVAQSVANGAEIKGILAMAPVGLSVLITLEESGIKTVKDLEGKMIGYKGAMPAHITAMLKKGGADLSKIKQVGVGFDPTILKTTEVVAITGFKSNEPYQLEKLGYKVRILDPEELGVNTSFGIVAANNDFAAKHPTAVEDYLRALLKAQEWIVKNPAETIKILEKRAGGNYNVEIESNRLKVETGLIETAKHKGVGLGVFTKEQWQSEINILNESGVLMKPVTAEQVADAQYISKVYDGEKLVWPEQAAKK